MVKVTARKSKTAAVRDIVLYDDLPDMTGEAVKTFQVISDCLYGTKNIGATENDALDCDCRDEWRCVNCFFGRNENRRRVTCALDPRLGASNHGLSRA